MWALPWFTGKASVVWPWRWDDLSTFQVSITRNLILSISKIWNSFLNLLEWMDIQVTSRNKYWWLLWNFMQDNRVSDHRTKINFDLMSILNGELEGPVQVYIKWSLLFSCPCLQDIICAAWSVQEGYFHHHCGLLCISCASTWQILIHFILIFVGAVLCSNGAEGVAWGACSFSKSINCLILNCETTSPALHCKVWRVVAHPSLLHLWNVMI